MEIQRDWSQLPSELLEQIGQRIVSISDFIRFRSVCKSWRTAALPNKLRPQPPLLLLAYNANNPSRYVFSLATRRAHHLVLPELVGKRILDCANGWMLLVDLESRALSLLNPVTLAQIQLPPNHNSERPAYSGYLFYDPFADCFVAVTRSSYASKEIGFIKVGDESWSVLANSECSYAHITYHRGKFFGYTWPNIYTHDASLVYSNHPVFAFSSSDIPGKVKYPAPIVSANGELLLCDTDLDDDPSKCLLIHKLDYEDQKVTWSNLQSEDYSLFKTPGGQCILCCVKDFPQFKENSVYLASYDSSGEFLDLQKPAVDLFDKKEGTKCCIPCRWKHPEDISERHSSWITLSFS